MLSNSFFSLFINMLIAFTLGRSSLVFLVANPIHSILSLIGVFFLGTCLLFFIQIEYYARLFLIVYVGAIVVLFLFIIRILELKRVNITQSLYNSFFIHYSVVISFFIFALLIISETLFNLRFIIIHSVLLEDHYIVNILSDVIAILKDPVNYIDNCSESYSWFESYNKYLESCHVDLSSYKRNHSIWNLFSYKHDNEDSHRSGYGLYCSDCLDYINEPLSTRNSRYAPADFIFFTESNIYVNWSKLIQHTDQLRSIGGILYTEYKISVILASILLFLSRVGALALTLFFPSSKKFYKKIATSLKIQDNNNQTRRFGRLA